MPEKKEPEAITVEIHGKEYETVASRVRRFRFRNPGYSIQTELLDRNDKMVCMVARIWNENQVIIATGHAEEVRGKGINVASAVENCETSAVGRALAMFGYLATDIASAEEMASEERKKDAGYPGDIPESELDPKEVKARELAEAVVDEEGKPVYTPIQIANSIRKARAQGRINDLIAKLEVELETSA